MQADLEDARNNREFSEFRFDTKESGPLHINQHCNNTLNADRWTGSRREPWVTTATSICSLLVSGTELSKADPQTPSAALYAVTPAHLVLTEEQCRKTLDENSSVSIETLRQEVNSKSAENRYTLTLPASSEDQHARSLISRKLDIQQPVMISYRRYFNNISVPTEDPNWLCSGRRCSKQDLEQCPHFSMNDIVLLPIERHAAEKLCEHIKKKTCIFESIRFCSQNVWLTEKKCNALVGKIISIGVYSYQVMQYNPVNISPERSYAHCIWFTAIERR